MNARASTDNMRGCLARTVANDQWPDAQVFVDRIPRASIGPLLETWLHEMYRDRKWEWQKPQPAPASKDWHVKPMEKM
jgi:acyl-CoA synthetase (AMP-forming)/AMP-acid ligase II